MREKEITLEIQKKALAALVKIGEAEYAHTLPEDRDKEVNIIRQEKKMYKVKEDCQCNLRKIPRERPLVKRCCASCQHKDIINIDEEDNATKHRCVRVCMRNGNKRVSSFGICDGYCMRQDFARI